MHGIRRAVNHPASADWLHQDLARAPRPTQLALRACARAAHETRLILEETLASTIDVGLPTVPREGESRPDDDARWGDRSDRAAARLVGKVGTGLLIAGIGLWIRQPRARKQPDAEDAAVVA